nr:amidohydrolase [Ornithinimicrobium sp. HY1745]
MVTLGRMRTDAGEPMSDDLIIYPARLVRTMDPARPTAEAVAVVGDRIRAVGSLDELSQYGRATIDRRYEESVIFPGMVEAHAHIMTGEMWQHTYVGYYERRSPDGRRWPGCESLEAVLSRLAEVDRNLDDLEAPILAWGLDPLNFPGERLNRRHLDAVSTTRPIMVLHQSFHLSTVNSAVLQRDGITRDTAMEGVVKDPDGEPNGELQEPPAMALVRSVQARPGESFNEAALRNFGADARNHGVTTIVDLGNKNLMREDYVAATRRVVEADDFPTRLSLFHMGAVTSPHEALPRVLALRETSSDKLHFGHIKLMLDGSIQGFTARLQPPGYLPDDREGIWLMAPEAFEEAFRLFHEAGLTVHVHCNGDEATELFVDTVERVLGQAPRWDHRHTVTHSQLTTPAQYRRMAALGMCANIFSNHLWYWGDHHRDLVLGPDRASRMNATATALRAGVPVTLHSDSPVTPLDALATASYAAERRTPLGKTLGEHERLTVPQALHAVTLGAAYTLKMDHLVGSLEAGKFADFAIMDADPYDAAPEELRAIAIQGSVLGGRDFPA